MSKRSLILLLLIASITIVFLGTALTNGVQEFAVSNGQLDKGDLRRFVNPIHLLETLSKATPQSTSQQMIAVHSAANIMLLLQVVLFCITAGMAIHLLRPSNKRAEPSARAYGEPGAGSP